jgi:hypothetical protein
LESITSYNASKIKRQFGGFMPNFYNTAFLKYSDEIPMAPLIFAKTITAKERETPHLVLGVWRSTLIAKESYRNLCMETSAVLRGARIAVRSS